MTAPAEPPYPHVQRFVEHLVSEVMSDRCTLVAESAVTPRNRGRCEEPAVAIRWEDGYADDVCDNHAAAAVRRGALVVRPKRHNGEPST